MKHTITKRILSLLLCILLCMSMLPVSALADEIAADEEQVNVQDEQEQNETEEDQTEQVEQTEEDQVLTEELLSTSEEETVLLSQSVDLEEDSSSESNENENDTDVDTGDYNFELTGISDVDVTTNTVFSVMDGVALSVKDKDSSEEVSDAVKENYRVCVMAVTRYKSGAADETFSFDPETQSSFKTPDESIYSYKIVYEIQHKQADGTWVAMTDDADQPMDFTRTITVVMQTELRETLDTDDEYIGSASVEAVADGTAPFDTDDPDNSPGNDHDASNDIVRSFDTVTYTIQLNSQAYSTGVSYENGYVWFKFILPCTSSEAIFDTGSMGWIATDSAHKSYTTTETIDGQICQVLYAARYLAPAEGQENALPVASMTVNLAVRVLAMKNGETITPKAYTWMDNNLGRASNPKNWTAEERVSLSKDTVCPDHADDSRTSGKEVTEITFKPVTVSAAPSYDINIVAGGNNERKTKTFDFTTGNSDAINHDAGSVYGQADRYGLQISLYNTDSAKGLRGIELPNGDDITFDVTFSVSYKATNSSGKVTETIDITDEYYPLVWSLDGNAVKTVRDNGRSLSGINTTTYLVGVPYNTGKSNYSANCYNGGTWSAEQDGATVHVTVSGYQINPSFFPVRNAGASDTTFTYYPTADAEGLSKAYIGAFSAGELEIVLPYGTGDDYLVNKYGSGTIYLTVKDVNLKVTSVSGQTVEDTAGTNDAEANQNNDSLSSTKYVSTPGSYTNFIHYSQNYGSHNDFNGVQWNQNGVCYTNGKDVGQVGQVGSITWGGTSENGGFDENSMTGLNALMKFDDKYLTICGTPKMLTSYLETGSTETFLYAYKKDGTGWSSFDEMNKAVESDLVYYPDLSSEHGVCVGVLMEGRTDTPEGSNAHRAMYAAIPVKLTEDYADAGQVAAICISSTVWKASNATGSAIPRRYDVSGAAVETPAARNTNVRADYVKATYSDAGVYTGGHTGSSNIGDSLYIVPYKTSVSKFVSQNADSTGADRKTNFDLDNSQTVVDFEIDSATINYAEGAAFENTTNVYIYDILPTGVSYIDGSGMYGGTYTQSSPVGYRGTVTDGESITPTVTTVKGTLSNNGFQLSSSGTEYTVLVWTIENVRVGDTLKPIYYSVKIDKLTAKNNNQYTNYCWITTDEIHTGDYRVSYGTFSHAGFKVTKNASMSMIKEADQLYVDAATDASGTEIGYTLTWQNTSENEMQSAVLMDTMPSNGENGSSFSGSWSMSGVTVQLPADTSASDYSFWYTTDASASSLTSDSYTASLIKANWTELTIAEDGSVTIPKEDAGTVTAWCIIGNLPGAGILRAQLTILAGEGNQPGDCFNNVISYGSGRSSASSYIVERKLSGLTWIDANKDGERSGREKLLSGVTVTLYQVDENGTVSNTPYVNILGENCQTETGSDGKYLFEHLGAGEFVVRFTSGTTTLEGNYYLTTQFAEGKNENRNSKAAQTKTGDNGTVSVADITGVEMPAAAEITSSPYFVRYQDAGFTTTEPAAIDVKLEVSKLLMEGTSDVSSKITAGQFTFTLTDKNTTGTNTTYYMPEEVTASTEKGTAGGAAVSFEAVTILQPGTYTFEITENESTDANCGADTGKITATVLVTKEANPNKEDLSSPYILKPVITYTYADADGTEVSTRGAAFINIHNTIEISGVKTWSDYNDQDGKRPDFIMVYLSGKVGSTEVYSGSVKVVPDQDGNWTYSFTGLDEYFGTDKITYTVSEGTVTGYKASISGYNITNTHEPEKTSITVTKIWDDNNDQDGKRASYMVTLYKTVGETTTAVDEQTLDKDTLSYTWSNQPVYENGTAIIYTVIENGVPTDYTSSTDTDAAAVTDGKAAITNTHKPETTDITVTKTWSDNNDQDCKRASYTVTLYKTVGENTIAVDAQTLDKDTLSYTWSDQPVYENGTAIIYTVIETGVPTDYTSSTDTEGATVTDGKAAITNTHKPETTDITVTKTWDDNNNQDGKRASYTVTLYKTVGEATTAVDEQTLDKDTLSYTWSNQPVYENGTAITYSVKENVVPTDYTSSTATENAAVVNGTASITNTHEPETVEITVTKVWSDADNQDGGRPETITVTLLADGETAAAVTSGEVNPAALGGTSSDSLSYTWTGMPKYADGNEITYTVEETGVVDGKITLLNSMEYTVTVEESDVNSYTITNTHDPETTSITVTKTWDDNDDQDGKRATYSVTLYKTVGETTTAVDSQTLDKDTLSYTWSNQPVYENGTAIIYTVIETGVPTDYTSSTDTEAAAVTDGKAAITNTHKPETTDITVTKTWDDNNDQDGKRASYTVTLYKTVGETTTAVDSQTLDKDTLSYTWSDQPAYENGTAIIYTVIETGVPTDYTSSTDTEAAAVTDGKVAITNTHDPELITISGSKIWNDNDDAAGRRPESITVHLFADDTEIDAMTVTEADGWAWSWADQPVYENGTKITYTVTEDPIRFYDTVINGYDITNTINTTFGNLTISKCVQGNLSKNTDEFTFMVTIDSDETFTYTGTYSGTIKNGDTITLKHGEYITIENIPNGTSYSVEETEKNGYVCYAEGDTGTITGDETCTAAFTNYKSSVPKTGDSSYIGIWYALLGMFMIGFAYTGVTLIRKKRNDLHRDNKN